MKQKKYILRFIAPLLLVVVAHTSGFAQYTEPLNIPPALSSGFGELRNNHFHSGIDFKTQLAVNKPVFSVADGYVSRISVSPSGYGLALYINHPELGQTSQYGHLNSFSKHIADYVEEKQYEQESYRINLYLEPHEIPVAKGEQIALSGNTGSSGGPHLHFEIRDKETQAPLDPLQFVAQNVRDTQSPDLRGIAFYPIDGQGVVNESNSPTRYTIYKSKTGEHLPIKKTTAWGKIGVGVKAYDRMNGQNNIYGVKHIRLFVDGSLTYSSTINEFRFDETRMLNSFVDFEDWRNNRSFFMKSFIEPGNTLSIYNDNLDGYIIIDQERPYPMRYELEDHHGNITTYRFVVQGTPQDIPLTPFCENLMVWNQDNRYASYDFTLTIPKGNLYTDCCFQHSSKATNKNYYSNLHEVNNTPVPLHQNGKIWIKISSDTLPQRDKYGIVRINKGNRRDSWLGGTYKNGGLELAVNELGNKYAISMDTIAPKIEPINPQTWKQNGRIRIKLTDDKSGIRSFRGTIDGKFVLFKHDTKSTIYTYTFNRKRLGELPIKHFRFVATDGVGNETVYEYEM